MIRKLFSYLIPITVYKIKSAWSKSIEVTLANGELVIDSENTNYSYGSLQRILRLGLKTIGFRQIKNMKKILVLGVAGGSVIKTLSNEIQFKGAITGVEIDPEIIKVANSYFHLNQIPNLTILIADAFEFVLQANEKYDLIIVDIFQDTKMPGFLFENFFTEKLCALLQTKGYILFNTMILDKNDNQRNEKYCSEFYQPNFKIKTIPRVEIHNELIIIEKIN
nr:fused MFS/spermidine synthase [uncultured Flavobacterium sp.]